MGPVDELPGHGVRATVDGEPVLVGNGRLLEQHDIPCAKTDAVGTVVHVAKNGTYLGYLVISDRVKDDAAETIRALKALGVRKTVLLTGDRQAVGEAVAKELGLDDVHAELLPGDKVAMVEALLKETNGGKLAFVGDGINDAPVLSRADVGVAMGAMGSDAAIEAADVVLMDDKPSKLAKAIAISRRTNTIVWQNIIFSLGVKILVMILGVFGVATMWEAVFADVGVMVIAICNATRALRIK